MTGGVDPLGVYLDVLFGRARPSTLVEVRWRTPSGMNRRFLAAGDRSRIAGVIRGRASLTDVYVGVLPRWRKAGGRAAIVGDCRTVWVDLDFEEAARALEPVEPEPSAVVATSRGHLHAYWSLVRAVPPAVIERANRRLAWALSGDLASVDSARILRPPRTLHHRRARAPITLLAASGHVCRLGELVGGLPDPPGHRSPARPRRRRPEQAGDPLLALDPERYIAVLTGQSVPRSRKVHCPLHEDRTASLHVYPDAARGWFCFGCRRGGSVYDLASAIWRIEPRGAGFVAIADRLRSMFR
jgi:hypothetical protein